MRIIMLKRKTIKTSSLHASHSITRVLIRNKELIVIIIKYAAFIYRGQIQKCIQSLEDSQFRTLSLTLFCHFTEVWLRYGKYTNII